MAGDEKLGSFFIVENFLRGDLTKAIVVCRKHGSYINWNDIFFGEIYYERS